jgi:hypothetical protein
MLNLRTQKNIRFFTVEKATVWLVFACVVETKGTEVVFVSEPKLVRIKPKVIAALPGKKGKVQHLALPVFIQDNPVRVSIASPYFSYEVSKDPNFLVWYNARPPTVYA